MKKNILLIATLAFTNLTWAKIPEGCKSNLIDIIARHNDFESRVSSMLDKGELTRYGVQGLREDHESVAEMVALLCSGLRKLELQRSLQGRIGFISNESAEEEAAKSYNEALEFYRQNIRK